MDTQLQVIVKESGLEITEGKSIIEKFGDYEKIAREWELKAKSIVVTDASQTTEMAMAKEARKHFSNLRINVEKTRVAMREQSLRKTQAINSVARFLVSLIKPIEDYLREQEDFVKIQEAKRVELLRIEAEKKEEADRLAREEANRIEQERIKAENEKLKLEAELREKKMAEERVKAEAERAKLEEIARKEREESERLAKEEKAKHDKMLAEEKARADAEKARIEEIARKEREEKERVQKLLNARVECPFCHQKFSIK
jgi:hypothetical protein